MKALLIVIAAASLSRDFAAAVLHNVQNTSPVSVDLTIPSDTGLVNTGNSEVDEQKFGGYRPLYPPYFLKQAENSPQQMYYDKEYYTRGTHYTGFDGRLDRRLTYRPSGPHQLAVASSANQYRGQYARAFPNYHVTVIYTNTRPLQFKTSSQFSRFVFPKT